MGKKDGGCMHIKLIEYHDYRTLMGPCLISFSLPLLIPGVVLTVVGSYGNEQTFDRFGGWHVAGIVILSLALIMLILGIVLKCCFRPVLSADIEKHLTPTSSIISGKHNLAYEKDSRIYSSNNILKGHSKVGHRDGDTGNDVIVSTHDSRELTEKYTNGQLRKPHHGKDQTAKLAHDIEFYENRTSSHKKKREELESGNVTHLPDPETFQGPAKKHRIKRTDSDNRERRRKSDKTESKTDEADSGEIKTKVTATVVAEAETSSGYRSREHSSDTNENSQFLPPPSDEAIKRRKKKKKRRKASSSGQNDSTDTSATERSVTELPDLRIKPVLVHDGSHHHPPNQHVHFEGTEEQMEVDTGQELRSEISDC